MESELLAQFGRIQDLVRVTFVDRLTAFFATPGVKGRWQEIPQVQKYEKRQNQQDDFSTAASIVQAFPDLPQRLPLIAITTTGGAQWNIGVGFPDILTHVHNYVVISANEGPYLLNVGDTLNISIGPLLRTIAFYTGAFADFNAVSIAELQAYINQISPGLRVTEEVGCLALSDFYGRDITILGGSAMELLGFTLNQGPDLTKFYEYLVLAESMDVLVDAMSSDPNQRTELMDLLCDFFGFYVYDENIGQWLTSNSQILFDSSYARRGEYETVLGSAPFSKGYGDSLGIPIRVIATLERVADMGEYTFENLQLGVN